MEKQSTGSRGTLERVVAGAGHQPHGEGVHYPSGLTQTPASLSAGQETHHNYPEF